MRPDVHEYDLKHNLHSANGDEVFLKSLQIGLRVFIKFSTFGICSQ